MTEAAGELYQAYQRLNPARSPTASPATLGCMARILTEAGSMKRAVAYLRWVAECPDVYPSQIRGVAPWPDGKCIRRSDPESLARHLVSRLDAVDAWTRDTQPPPDLPTANDLPPKVADDLDFLDRLASTGTIYRPPLYDRHPDPKRAERIVTVLYAAEPKGWDAWYTDPVRTRARVIRKLMETAA